MTLFLISLIPYFLVVVYKTKKSLQMLQQNYYDDDNRYFKWIISNISKISFDISILFVLIILTLFFEIGIEIGAFIILYGIIYMIYTKDKKVDKKPLVVTARVKRLIFTMMLVYIILILPVIINFNYDILVYEYVILGLVCYLNCFVIMTINRLNKPIEYLVYLWYKRKAMKKLKCMNIPVLGITGSYGKTSCKNIVNSILSANYITYPTPKSFNTPYGLMISINNGIDKFTNMFIAEMGAYKKGEIKELCDFVNPKYGILTTIGVAHLETFKSEQNIIDGKFELIESLPSDGVAILNKDDIKQATHKINNNCKILWIGIDNKDADVVASNIKLSSTGTTFDVKFKDLENKYTFTTSLLGKYNIYNILDGLALGHYLNISIDKMIQKVATLKPIEHRLELRKYYDITLIDDAFNSNPVGSSMARDVLSLMPGKKIIVTPGMIELGEKEYEYNYNFGKKISEVCDEVILVGENQTKPIKKALDDNKFTKVHIINDVKEAFTLMNKLKDKNTYVLLENDLPDIFNEK